MAGDQVQQSFSPASIAGPNASYPPGARKGPQPQGQPQGPSLDQGWHTGRPGSDKRKSVRLRPPSAAPTAGITSATPALPQATPPPAIATTSTTTATPVSASAAAPGDSPGARGTAPAAGGSGPEAAAAPGAGLELVEEVLYCGEDEAPGIGVRPGAGPGAGPGPSAGPWSEPVPNSSLLLSSRLRALQEARFSPSGDYSVDEAAVSRLAAQLARLDAPLDAATYTDLDDISTPTVPRVAPRLVGKQLSAEWVTQRHMRPHISDLWDPTCFDAPAITLTRYEGRLKGPSVQDIASWVVNLNFN